MATPTCCTIETCRSAEYFDLTGLLSFSLPIGLPIGRHGEDRFLRTLTFIDQVLGAGSRQVQVGVPRELLIGGLSRKNSVAKTLRYDQAQTARQTLSIAFGLRHRPRQTRTANPLRFKNDSEIRIVPRQSRKKRYVDLVPFERYPLRRPAKYSQQWNDKVANRFVL